MFRISFLCCLVWFMAAQPARAEWFVSDECDSARLQPQFPDGGLAGFRRWVLGRLTFPVSEFDPGDPVMVQVSMRVSRKGKISEAGLIRTSHDAVGRQVMKLIGRSPDWKPAVRGGKAADAEMRLSFDMRLHNVAAAGADPLLRAEDVSIYTRADTLPACVAGDMVEWVRARVLAADPAADDALQCRVVRLVVEKDGSVSETKIMGGEEDRLDKSIKEALRDMPAWSPAVALGEAVRFRVQLEVPFGPEARAESAQQGPYLLVEQMPSFQGGDLDTFRQWVHREVKYPAEALRAGASGRVVVSFIVEKDGTVSHIEVLRSPHAAFTQEVIRALGSSPAWTPGSQYGRIVRVKYTLPVDFRAARSRPARSTGVDAYGRKSPVRRF
ncbi:energy transducer TonB [Alistipes sp.]|uniref:energy transducer TonB n=1 Tax=Alistipes sp. TaxID=1872444 RepID=UPI003AF06C80